MPELKLSILAEQSEIEAEQYGIELYNESSSFGHITTALSSLNQISINNKYAQPLNDKNPGNLESLTSRQP